MMRRLFLLAVLAAACARGPKPITFSPEEERCSAISDTLSKYVSEDALPFAHVAGTPRTPPAPSKMQPGDSAAVEFVVLPNGVADTSTVLVIGASDPEFIRRAIAFAGQNRFTPAQVSGCNVMSRYDLVVKSRL